MSESKDLWPDLGGLGAIRTPKNILAEQAIFLNEKTKNVINAKVETNPATSRNDDFYQFFILSVPSLNNYSFELFYVSHSIALYPCRLHFEGVTYSIADEEEFAIVLQTVFSSPSTQKILQSLYSQAIQ